MEIFSTTKVWILVLLIAAYIAVMGLAGYKLIKSRISDRTKIYLFVLMAVANIISAVLFILYHDYILQKSLRAD